MSIESMVIALHHSRAKGATKLVLLGIANHDGDGGAWPSVATLQKYAGINRRNVQQAIKRLEQLGEIRRHMQDGGTASLPDHLRPNRYEFTLQCPDSCDRSSRHAPWGVAGDTPPRVAGDTPPRVAGDTQTILEEPSMKGPMYVRALRDRRPEPFASDKQKHYIRHMQDVIGWDFGLDSDDPEQMSSSMASGWIEVYMGDYRKAGGGEAA
ncbi:helix-turn-helix domain-containing protein [Microbacterium horticulturae]|uniref:Helix-turn-helix domain-containing protein n=1 Tax=Microbacterium horticulturae TaxID=3028316 RepID=A0ABY8C3X9_9MICO|nr:helix-turn-helix domain-containing protein [Microbacterium sp. KACC 23027]WEG10427.1 helix-turn-helix domain-containing protein [Microbacterium sp. KACC 23027]